MRILTAILIVSLFVLSSVTAADNRYYCKSIDIKNDCHMDGVSIDVDDGTLIITYKDGGYSRIEITEDYELYVNGRLVKTDREQKELIEDYYDQAIEIIEYAKEIGFEGAEIGIEGAKIGLKAVKGVFKLLLANYDTDDLERDMEREAAKLEARAEKLEEKADELEDMADELEERQEELADHIPELDELDWF